MTGRIAVIALAGLIVFGGLAAGFLTAGDDADGRGLAAVDLRKPEDDLQLVAIDDDEGEPSGDGDRTKGDDGTGGGNNTGDGDRTRERDGTRGGNNGGANSEDRDRTRGNDGTNGGNNRATATARAATTAPAAATAPTAPPRPAAAAATAAAEATPRTARP